MAARVLLLSLLTGLFAVTWNSDRPDRKLGSVPLALRRSPRVPLETDEPARPGDVTKVGVATVTSTEFDLSAVALPEAIAQGTYRIVDEMGRVGWITIPASETPATESERPAPFYASQSEQGRWYFVRVESAPIIAAPQTDSRVRR